MTWRAAQTRQTLFVVAVNPFLHGVEWPFMRQESLAAVLQRWRLQKHRIAKESLKYITTIVLLLINMEFIISIVFCILLWKPCVVKEKLVQGSPLVPSPLKCACGPVWCGALALPAFPPLPWPSLPSTRHSRQSETGSWRRWTCARVSSASAAHDPDINLPSRVSLTWLTCGLE